jgi:hypothetical protein
MKITISEKQLKLIIGNTIDMAEQEATTTSTTAYPTVNKWESGATRGPANQIGNTKWSDIVGSTLVRGKANKLT